jgi:acyl-CoA thioesterase-1
MKHLFLSRRRFLRNTLLLAPVPVFIAPLSLAKFQVSAPLVTGEKELLQIAGALANKQHALKWLFTGDSITQGVKHTAGLRSFSEIFTERIRWEMDRMRDFVINTAVSGQNSNDVLSDFDWRVNQFAPSVVFIMLATNDCASTRPVVVSVFESNLNQLVDKVRQMGGIPVLQTPNTFRAAESPERAKLPEYVEIIRAVARKRDTILVDHWTYWEACQKSNLTDDISQRWMNDRLHPNGYGHLEMARLIFKTLRIFDANAFTCSGKIIGSN